LNIISNTFSKWQLFALLLIDVQNDFWEPQLQEAFPKFPNNIYRLLNFCRQEGLEMISDCCADYPESHALTLKRYLNY